MPLDEVLQTVQAKEMLGRSLGKIQAFSDMISELDGVKDTPAGERADGTGARKRAGTRKPCGWTDPTRQKAVSTT